MQNRIIGVIAPKGSGKTYAVTQYMQQLERVAAFDMVHETAYLCAEPVEGQPRRFAELLSQEKFKVVYRPIIFKMANNEEYCPAFEPFVTLCYLRGNMTMIVDEAHQLCNPHTCPPALLTAIRLGRHRRLSIIFITQSFSAVARPLTQNADEFWFWRIIEPSDLDGIRARCGSAVRERVEQLRRLDMDQKGNVTPGEMLRWTTYEGIAPW